MKIFRNVVTRIVVLGLFICAVVVSSDESCPVSKSDNSVDAEFCSSSKGEKSCGCGSSTNRQENDSPSKYSEASNVDIDKETTVKDETSLPPLHRPEEVDFLRQNQMVLIKGK